MNAYDVIKRPIITEKTTIQKETHNQVTFEVDRRVNRVEVKRAVEELFKVRVAAVTNHADSGQSETPRSDIGKTA